MTDKTLKSAPLAYENEKFLERPGGRVLRILSEYIEPLSRFRREQIQDTVVFFGSARFHDMESAEHNLQEIRAAAPRADTKTLIKRANAAVEMARYYEDAR